MLIEVRSDTRPLCRAAACRCGPLLFEVEANGDSASPGSAETGRARQEGDRGADEAAVGDEEEANADVKRDAKRTRKQRRGETSAAA